MTMKRFEDEMRAIAAYKVEDLMSKDIVTVNENDTFDYVANIMINKSINRVPVVDKENFLKGIICRYDIIKAMYIMIIRRYFVKKKWATIAV